MPGLPVHVSPEWLLVACVACVFLETAILLGFLLPGETTALLAGVDTALGHVSLPLAIGLVVTAAILGDSVGYAIGRRWFAAALERLRPLRRLEEPISTAQDYLHRRGGLAVFLARFTPFGRTAMPRMAGSAEMGYGRFLRWDVLAAVVWGSASVLIGNLLGDGYQRVAGYVGPGFAIPAVVVAVAALVWHRLRSRRRDSTSSR